MELSSLVGNIPPWIWLTFLGFVGFMLALDLGVFHRKSHKVELKESLVWSAVWIALALVFNAVIFQFWPQINPGSLTSSRDAGVEFFTGYLIEKALSVDNLFIFIVIFQAFRVPAEYQHKVLFWGVFGALIFRAIGIGLGASLLKHFHWTMLIFGALLIVTGIKMLVHHDKKIDTEKHIAVRWFRKIMPVTSEYHGDKFFKRIDGRMWATPLFVALLLVEFTDVIFAIDSIPAIFAITSEPFIVFTSNVFAILGLRSLYFALGGLLGMFRYLNYGLSAVLVFVGLKMLYGYVQADWMKHLPKIPTLLSLAIVALIFTIAIAASVVRDRQAKKTGALS